MSIVILLIQQDSAFNHYCTAEQPIALNIMVVCDHQKDDSLSAGRSPYVNYCGILQQFVQAHISKQQVNKPQCIWIADK